MRVLVTDPEQRAALATVRALGTRGWSALTIGETPGLAGVSRYTERHLAVPAGTTKDARRFRDAVAAVVGCHGIDIILPVTDRASRALLGYDSDVGAKIAGPSRDAYLAASDKAKLIDVAVRCGIRVPAQRTLTHPGSEIPPMPQSGHVVVKPSHSVVEVQGKLLATAVRYAAGEAQLRKAVAAYPAEAFPLMIQERILGEGAGVFLLRSNGDTLLTFGHRRIREKPPAGGVSTCREAVEPPPAVVAQCEALLDALHYSGAAMVEFKMDGATGEYVLMEINARLWGSVQLAIDAGLDFPSALVQITAGAHVERVERARAGVRSIWEFGELDHAWALMTKSREALSLPPGHQAGWRAALHAILDRRREDRLEVFRLDDWRPFAAEFARWFRRD